MNPSTLNPSPRSSMHVACLLAAVAVSIAACNRSEPAPSTSAGSPEQKEASAPAAGRVAVGDTAPGFTLKDQTGGAQTLAALIAKGKLALVFYRSADW